MKYKKAFGWGQSGTNPLKWLIGEGEPDSKAAERTAYLEKRVKDLEGANELTLRQKISTLESDAYDLREKNRNLSGEAAKAKGIDVLNTELEAYRVFGKPDELKVNLEQAALNATEVQNFKRREVVAKAAEISTLEFEVNGKKESRAMNAKTLAELVEMKNLELEIGTTKIMKDGKIEETPAAYVKGSDGKPVALGEYVRSNLSSFVNSLAEAPASSGTPFVPQPRGDQTPPAGDGAFMDSLIAAAAPKTPAFNPFGTTQPVAPTGGT
jgi:hypothetical protein